MSNSVWMTACRLLARYLSTGARLDQLVETTSGPLRASAIDRRRLRHLLYGAVRHRALLERALEAHMRRPPRPVLRAALVLGGFELLEHPEQAPAIVHHAVGQARMLVSAGEIGVVNAVLRRVVGTLASLVSAQPGDVAGLALRFSHPQWLVERWVARWGLETTRRLLEWNQAPALVYARVIGLPVAPGGNQADPQAEGLPRGLVPTRWKGFFELGDADWDAVEAALAAGRLYLQDPATRLAPDLLAVQPGETVLDLCAAPGGKTLQLAGAVGAGGKIVAVDLPGPRLERLRENVARHAGWSITVVPGDVARLTPAWLSARDLPETCDAVLLDVPCSNTGVLRHRVDAKWRLRPEDIAELTALQGTLLRAAAALVRPGGRLVYSTCSLEREENEGVVESFLAETGGEGSAFVLERTEASHPWESGCDGAGAVLLRRLGV